MGTWSVPLFRRVRKARSPSSPRFPPFLSQTGARQAYFSFFPFQLGVVTSSLPFLRCEARDLRAFFFSSFNSQRKLSSFSFLGSSIGSFAPLLSIRHKKDQSCQALFCPFPFCTPIKGARVYANPSLSLHAGAKKTIEAPSVPQIACSSPGSVPMWGVVPGLPPPLSFFPRPGVQRRLRLASSPLP